MDEMDREGDRKGHHPAYGSEISEGLECTRADASGAWRGRHALPCLGSA